VCSSDLVIPFEDNKKGVTLATFQIGYKGYLQLAMRSGQYIDITVSEIKAGEFISFSPITEKFQFVDLPLDSDRDSLPTVGYYAAFEYANGFKKALYWPIQKMRAHAEKYSFAYQTDLKKGWKNSFWSKDFDAMAKKTMLRQLLTKWGIMSSELIQAAMERDYQAVSPSGDWGGYPDQEYQAQEEAESRLEELVAMAMAVMDDRELILSYIKKSAAVMKISTDAFAVTAIERFDDFAKAFEVWALKEKDAAGKTIEVSLAEPPAPPKEEPWDGQSPPTMPKPKTEKARTVDEISGECFDLCAKAGRDLNEMLEMMFPGVKKDTLSLENWRSFRATLDDRP
jgi:recombinational DNA repair protein RecT